MLPGVFAFVCRGLEIPQSFQVIQAGRILCYCFFWHKGSHGLGLPGPFLSRAEEVGFWPYGLPWSLSFWASVGENDATAFLILLPGMF